MPIRSQNVTAPQDRPPEEPKAPAPEPAAPAPAKDEPKDADAPETEADQADETVKAEGPVRSRVIAVPMRTVTDDDGSTRQVPELFGLPAESVEPTDTDYGNVAKFRVKAATSILDELETRAHEALTFKRTAPARDV